jgi:cytochrome P450
VLDKLGGEDIFDFVTNTLILNTKRSQTPFAYLFGKNFHKWGFRAIDREVDKRAKMFMAFSEDIISRLVGEFREKKGASSGREGIIDLAIRNNWLVLEGEPTAADRREKYTIPEMVSEVASFFLAGTETTATTMTALIYVLAQRPDLLAKAREEVKTVLGERSVAEVGRGELKKCQYAECLIKEALRMYSPVPTMPIRLVIKEHYIGKIPMKQGIQVAFKYVTNHYREEFWHDPTTFDPERWIGLDPSKQPPASFFPFSSGPRVCIGQHLALL